MGNPAVDPSNVVQALVYTLLDVFDATRDLYQTLRLKEKRDYEQSLRAKRLSRELEYLRDEEEEEGERGDESLALDRSAVKRRFEVGVREVGGKFAVGDVITQTALQSQIITLQSALITTFLYGPTTPDPISKHLSVLVTASREAGLQAVDALSAQQLRQLSIIPTPPRSTRSPAPRSSHPHRLPYPVTNETSTSTALIKSSSRNDHDDRSSPYPAKTTILTTTTRPPPQRTDTESTAFSGPISYATSPPQPVYCPYALDLQNHSSQPLSSSITHSTPGTVPFCPHCTRTLQLSPGKSWEVIKHDTPTPTTTTTSHLTTTPRERCFHISNRFVVKCHRPGADAGYMCVLCSRGASANETVCGDVKALVKHVWQDHAVWELEGEEDVEEWGPGGGVRRRSSVKQREDRRDSGLGLGVSGRRSVSLGPRRREVVEVVEYGRMGRPH
ncbi:hypothetical protein DM02DRAFT_721870 [Periconia macrospinosa]|uniref:Uncharacterized protein n=1 Tax=Periconia macrospinosa TaxID=97972 RepID=A0A2V1D4T4_9PLEO|nr:hypothetical protein DM02DRAFT_721870 [Periconia macrospinosa]